MPRIFILPNIMKLSIKLTTILLLTPLLKAGEPVLALTCPQVKILFYQDVAHMRDQLVGLTFMYLDTHPNCSCDILKEASKISSNEERVKIESWIKENFQDNTREYLLSCFKKHNDKPLAPTYIPYPWFYPIENDPPVTQTLEDKFLTE